MVLRDITARQVNHYAVIHTQRRTAGARRLQASYYALFGRGALWYAFALTRVTVERVSRAAREARDGAASYRHDGTTYEVVVGEEAIERRCVECGS